MNDRIPQLHVGRGTTLGALTLFPVWIDSDPVRGLEWRPTLLQVSERAGSPVVGELVAHNPTPRPMVALEGDLITGGWQDRMLASSVVLAPGEARMLDALCVEHGRWSGAQVHRTAGRRAALGVRHQNLSARTRPERNAQHDVWGRIARLDSALGGSATATLTAHLDRVDVRQLPRPVAGQRGVIVGVGGRILGAELFGSPRGLALRWRGILEAAVLDARLATEHSTPAWAARDFARVIAGMRLERGVESGMAHAIASSRGSVRATGLTRESMVHLSLLDESHPVLEVAA